jgi:hypothetical protein
MMAPRVTSDLLLVGSVPADSSAQALQRCGRLFADVVAALPDGETECRSGWVNFEGMTMYRNHPDVEIMQDQTLAPGAPWWKAPPNIWLSHQFAFRKGVTETRYDRLTRVDEAIESYRIFKSMKEEGKLPADLRFQLCLPFPASAFGFLFVPNFEHDYPIHEKAYEEAFGRELPRLLDVVPADELAIQWDICFEVLDLERLFPYTSADLAWQRFAGPASRISRNIPEEVLVGYHFCYGTFPEWPMREADDMQLIVDMANAAVDTADRTVDWLHLAGPRHLRSHDDGFFRPLQQLRPRDARVFLGLILPVDGEIGLGMRTHTASKYLHDFGVSMYCGFGRQPGKDAETTLREHREVVDAFRGDHAAHEHRKLIAEG